MATDLLARIRSEINERLAQLRPLLNEYERLTAAAETLAAVDYRPPAPVDAVAEVETPHAERPDVPAAQEVPELPAAAPPPPVETPRLPLGAPRAPAEEPPSAPALRRTYPLRGKDGAIKLAMSLRTTPLIQPTPRPAAQRVACAPSATQGAAQRVAPAPSATQSAAQRVASAPSATQVLEQPTPAPSTLGRDTWAGSAPVPDSEPQREPASPAAVRQAILEALEHGSHTAGELVMVTAMSTPEIRGGLVRLVGRGAITKVKRRGDGKTAYALPFSRA